MSSPHPTSSPHKHCLAKTKASKECMEEEWRLISKEKRAWEEAECLACEEAERKVEEECKAQEEAVGAKEEAKRIAKEATVREEAAKKVVEAAKERANVERRALEDGRMTMGGPSTPGWRASGIQDPCTRCCNKGTLCVLGMAKGKTMVCKACHHAKASCSWSKKMARETQKQKQVQQLEETEDVEMIRVGEDNKEEEVWLHFAVPTHLTEDHRDTLGALMTMLDKMSTDFLAFRSNDLKEEEMGKSKGKGKEKAKEEFRRVRTDKDGDIEMGRAGPSSLA
ncbi:hypothetical protein ID866_9383 [Astraeus odoratus]|nr:hypothetical protein ID866_9383 [Astraeus odoratus]